MFTAQRSWWAEGVQAGWVPAAQNNGGAGGAPPLLLEDGSEHGGYGFEQFEGAAYNTHSPHYYHNLHGQGSNMAEEAASGGPQVLGFEQYDKYGEYHPALQWGAFDGHPAPAAAGDMYHFDHHGFSAEDAGFGGGQHGGALAERWTDELVGKLAAVTTNGAGSGSGAAMGRSGSGVMGGSGMALSSAAISRTASVVANGGGFGGVAAQQGGGGGGSVWPTPWTSPRTTAPGVAAGPQQLASSAFWEKAPRVTSATPRAPHEQSAPLTQSAAVAGSPVVGALSDDCSAMELPCWDP